MKGIVFSEFLELVDEESSMETCEQVLDVGAAVPADLPESLGAIREATRTFGRLFEGGFGAGCGT